MFTGIVEGLGCITEIKGEVPTRLCIELPSVEDLAIGASVAIDGVCLTAVEINGTVVSFDVIPETLSLTTLSDLRTGARVNVERALRMGDELGGHLLSGHIMGKGKIIQRQKDDNHHDIHIELDAKIIRFIQEKGFVAIDGISLTVGKVNANSFALHLIPETLRLTTINHKLEGDYVNVEIDSMTQTIVETVERMLEEKL
jgi:riboflavin synthase